jgi:hypothetical protein
VSWNSSCAIRFCKCSNTKHWEEILIFSRQKFLCPLEFLTFRSNNDVDACWRIHRNTHLIFRTYQIISRRKINTCKYRKKFICSCIKVIWQE